METLKLTLEQYLKEIKLFLAVTLKKIYLPLIIMNQLNVLVFLKK
jgi:hypothetical protein